MRDSKQLINSFIGLLCFFSIIHAQTITLEQFLDELKRVHPLFEKEDLSVEIYRQDQESYLGARDWMISSGPYFTRQNPLPPGSFSPATVDQMRIGAKAQRAFWKTGGRLSFSWTSDLTDQQGLEEMVLPIGTLIGDPSVPDLVFETGPPKYYQNELAITYAHPLLKNRGGSLDRLQYDLNSYNIDFSEIQAMENKEKFLANAAGKFLDWVLLTEQRKIIQERLQLSEAELARTKEKRSANLVDQVDVIRTEDVVRIGRQNQILVEGRWNALQSELAILSMNSDIFNLSPEFALDSLTEYIDFEEASTYLNQHSRLISSLNIRLDQLREARSGYEEVTKPDLSLIARVNSKQLEEDLGESLKLSKTDTYLGLQFSVPLQNRTAKSQVTKSDLQIKKLEKEILDVSLTLTSSLINIYVQLEQMEEVLNLNEQQILSAKERTAEEIALYNQGRNEMAFVIQSQDSEEHSKLNYAVNAVTYHKLIIAYKSLLDQIL